MLHGSMGMQLHMQVHDVSRWLTQTIQVHKYAHVLPLMLTAKLLLVSVSVAQQRIHRLLSETASSIEVQ